MAGISITYSLCASVCAFAILCAYTYVCNVAYFGNSRTVLVSQLITAERISLCAIAASAWIFSFRTIRLVLLRRWKHAVVRISCPRRAISPRNFDHAHRQLFFLSLSSPSFLILPLISLATSRRADRASTPLSSLSTVVLSLLDSTWIISALYGGFSGAREFFCRTLPSIGPVVAVFPTSWNVRVLAEFLTNLSLVYSGCN